MGKINIKIKCISTKNKCVLYELLDLNLRPSRLDHNYCERLDLDSVSANYVKFVHIPSID